MRLLRRLGGTLVPLALLAACGQGGMTPTSAAASSGAGGTGGGLPAAQPFMVFDWNTHNFFDTTDNNTLGIVLSPADYQTKLKGIGGTIKAYAPDVVMLAEVENQGILDDMNKGVLDDAYGTRVVIQANDPRGINVGLLSKIVPDQVVSHKDEFFPQLGTNGPLYKYSRDCLEVHLTVNGRKIVLLGVHFKAKTAPDEPLKRLAEGQHTRAIADALSAADPTVGIIILGDYNDLPGSPPVAAVEGQAPTPYADTANAVSMAYSFDFNGQKQLIDHQEANPILAAMLDPASVSIPHGAGIDDSSTGGSDHAPIVATYHVR
jgi:endonuclease/exonuclease/phosphatase family metal-dependent hydrolase